jgi:hypothetical protein
MLTQMCSEPRRCASACREKHAALALLRPRLLLRGVTLREAAQDAQRSAGTAASALRALPALRPQTLKGQARTVIDTVTHSQAQSHTVKHSQTQADRPTVTRAIEISWGGFRTDFPVPMLGPG